MSMVWRSIGVVTMAMFYRLEVWIEALTDSFSVALYSVDGMELMLISSPGEIEKARGI